MQRANVLGKKKGGKAREGGRGEGVKGGKRLVIR
jgi:hypothetical protein